MRTWKLGELDIEPHKPTILSSSKETRAIALELPAGERLGDHEVHERAWLVVATGEVELSAGDGEAVAGGPGLAAEFDPGERHEVVAVTDARLLLLLTPWPGEGHPGVMSLEDKGTARDRAAGG